MTLRDFIEQPFEPYTIRRFSLGKKLNKDLFSIMQILNNDYCLYTHEIDSYGIKHVITRHGSDQTPIVYEDFEKIQFIICDPDTVSYVGLSNIKTPVISYRKRMGDVLYHYFEEVRTGKKTLSMKTFYKTKETL
jgi:hypothetical protein